MRSFQGSSRKLLLTYLVTSKRPPRKPRPLPLLCAPPTPPLRPAPVVVLLVVVVLCAGPRARQGEGRRAPCRGLRGFASTPPPLPPAPCARLKKSPRRASALGKARAAESPAPAPEAVGFAHTAVAGRDGLAVALQPDPTAIGPGRQPSLRAAGSPAVAHQLGVLVAGPPRHREP